MPDYCNFVFRLIAYTRNEVISMAKRGPRRSRKNKYITLYSPFLMKETKHELIGEPIESEEGVRQQWARCTKSRHSQLINLDTLEAKQNGTDLYETTVSREDSVTYNPRREYNIGEVVYHELWDDVGRVTGKEITSNGGYAIVVHFEKNKEKRLIEKLGS